MFVGSPRRLAAAAMVVAASYAGPGLAQSNPFVPDSAMSRSGIERLLEEKLEAMRADISQLQAEQSASPPVVGPAGPPGMPGAPVPGAGMSGVGVDGGMMPPGAYGPEMAAGNFPPDGMLANAKDMGPVEEARAGGVRFIGCINGTPKFTRASGERVTFSKADLSEAVEAGLLPECR